MAGRYEVNTRTFLPSDSINFPNDIVSKSNAVFSGDTPHESEIAGDATAQAITGHSHGHGIYFASKSRYRIRQ